MCCPLGERKRKWCLDQPCLVRGSAREAGACEDSRSRPGRDWVPVPAAPSTCEEQMAPARRYSSLMGGRVIAVAAAARFSSKSWNEPRAAVPAPFSHDLRAQPHGHSSSPLSTSRSSAAIGTGHRYGRLYKRPLLPCPRNDWGTARQRPMSCSSLSVGGGTLASLVEDPFSSEHESLVGRASGSVTPIMYWSSWPRYERLLVEDVS